MLMIYWLLLLTNCLKGWDIWLSERSNDVLMEVIKDFIFYSSAFIREVLISSLTLVTSLGLTVLTSVIPFFAKVSLKYFSTLASLF